MKLLRAILFTGLGAGLFFASCKKDEVTPTPELADVSLEFEYTVGDEAMVLGEVYEINGTAVQFDLVNFYVGGIGLVNEMGEKVQFENKYLLVKANQNQNQNRYQYQLGQVNAGHYDTLQFFVGVGPTENSQTEADFTNRPADDPLAVQNPSMHWSWASGYRFIRIDGLTDVDGDGTPETLMEYHLGTDPFLINLQYGMHKDLDAGANQYRLQLNLAQVLEGVDMKQEYGTHTMDNMMLAQRIRNNFANALQLGQ